MPDSSAAVDHERSPEPVSDEASTSPATLADRDSRAPAPERQPTTATAPLATPAGAAARRRLSIVALAAAVGGMAVGGTVEFLVGSAIEATGWFGASIDALIEDQKANFDDLRAKLDELSKAEPGSPEAKRIEGEIQKIVASQEKLTGQTHQEIRTFQQEIARLNNEMLQTRGTSSGADFWLGVRESATLHERGVVLALNDIRNNGAYIHVTLLGKTHQLKPGDVLEFPKSSGEGVCKVIYKTGRPRDDDRLGFDLVCD